MILQNYILSKAEVAAFKMLDLMPGFNLVAVILYAKHTKGCLITAEPLSTIDPDQLHFCLFCLFYHLNCPLLASKGLHYHKPTQP